MTTNPSHQCTLLIYSSICHVKGRRASFVLHTVVQHTLNVCKTAQEYSRSAPRIPWFLFCSSSRISRNIILIIFTFNIIYLNPITHKYRQPGIGHSFKTTRCLCELNQRVDLSRRQHAQKLPTTKHELLPPKQRIAETFLRIQETSSAPRQRSQSSTSCMAEVPCGG